MVAPTTPRGRGITRSPTTPPGAPHRARDAKNTVKSSAADLYLAIKSCDADQVQRFLREDPSCCRTDCRLWVAGEGVVHFDPVATACEHGSPEVLTLVNQYVADAGDMVFDAVTCLSMLAKRMSSGSDVVRCLNIVWCQIPPALRSSWEPCGAAAGRGKLVMMILREREVAVALENIRRRRHPLRCVQSILLQFCVSPRCRAYPRCAFPEMPSCNGDSDVRAI